MLTETRERFARAIVAKVPAERIVEIHFFQPIRQGGVESGVAVVAAQPERPLSVEGELPNTSGALPVPEDLQNELLIEDVPEDVSAPDDCVIIPAHTVEPENGVRVVERRSDEEENDVVASDREVELPSGHTPFDAPDDISGDEDDEDAEARRKAYEALAALDALSTPAVANAVTEREGPLPRLTVFTARYRLVLKGPERGRWEASVVAEADAPLPTVDAVVRGVLRRAGDAEDAERMSGEELAGELRQVLGPRA